MWGFTGLLSTEIALYEDEDPQPRYNASEATWTWRSRVKNPTVKGYQSNGENWEEFRFVFPEYLLL